MSKRKYKEALSIVQHNLEPDELDMLRNAIDAQKAGVEWQPEISVSELKDQIAEREAKIVELEEKIERQNVAAEFGWLPSASAMNNEIVRLRRENDNMVRAVLDVDKLVREGARKYTQQAHDNYKKLLPAEQNGQLSDLAKAILTHTEGPLH
jgi:hypothetical protein